MRDADSVMANTVSAKSLTVISAGLPRLTAPWRSRLQRHEFAQAIDEIGNEAERPGLLSRAVDGQVFVRERLCDDVGHHPAIIGPHAWAVRVEYARHPHSGAARPAKIERERLRRALAFVVTGARTRRIDVAPIVLPLADAPQDRRRSRSSTLAGSGRRMLRQGAGGGTYP